MKNSRKLFSKRMMFLAGGILAVIAFMLCLVVTGDPLVSMASFAMIPIFGTVEGGDFKKLTAEELGKLEAEHLEKYFEELNKFKAKQLEDYKEELKKETSEELQDKIDALKAEITKDNITQNKAILASVKAIGLAVKKLKSGGYVNEKKTLKSIIEPIHTEILESLNKMGGKYELEIGKGTVSMSSITDDPAGIMIPGFAEIQTQNNRLAAVMNTFPLGPDSHGIVRWTDWTTATSAAAARADGAAAAEATAAWTGYSRSLENISVSIKVHLEALRDIALMEAELKNFLTNDVAVVEDNDLYSGDGNTPNIKGIAAYTTAFDPAVYLAAGGFAVSSPNMYDLIVSMAAQIMKASKYQVNAVVVNPYDALRMKLNKDDNNNYLMPPFVVGTPGGEFFIDNMRVIQSNSVTVNTCVVGDFTKARRYVGENINISMGFDASGDFKKRIITILANVAELLIVRNAEVDAFLKSTDITNDIQGIKAEVA